MSKVLKLRYFIYYSSIVNLKIFEPFYTISYFPNYADDFELNMHMSRAMVFSMNNGSKVTRARRSYFQGYIPQFKCQNSFALAKHT